MCDFIHAHYYDMSRNYKNLYNAPYNFHRTC